MKNKTSGNYTGNELSRAVKLRAAVLGVADFACALSVIRRVFLNRILRNASSSSIEVLSSESESESSSSDWVDDPVEGNLPSRKLWKNALKLSYCL